MYSKAAIRAALVVCLAAGVLVVSLRAENPKPATPVEYKPPAAIASKPLEFSADDGEQRRQRKTQYNESLPEMRKRFYEYLAGQAKPALLFQALYRTMNLELALRTKPADDVAIYKRYIEVAEAIEEIELARYVAERADKAEVDEVRDFRLDLKIAWVRARWTAETAKR